MTCFVKGPVHIYISSLPAQPTSYWLCVTGTNSNETIFSSNVRQSTECFFYKQMLIIKNGIDGFAFNIYCKTCMLYGIITLWEAADGRYVFGNVMIIM